ncbi:MULTISPECIES: IS30 family transposase [unclassified Vibrio]|nr:MULTISPECIES: IS30 family transposase [unclassified Vibrio]
MIIHHLLIRWPNSLCHYKDELDFYSSIHDKLYSEEPITHSDILFLIRVTSAKVRNSTLKENHLNSSISSLSSYAAEKCLDQSTFYEFKTITADNGTEFAGHQEVAKITNADFYFAKQYNAWERGLNEHTNGLIRRFLPKVTDFNEVSD